MNTDEPAKNQRQQGAIPMLKRRKAVATLKKRAEFLRIRGGGRSSCGAFLLEGKPRPADTSAEGASALPGKIIRPGRQAANVTSARFGFTITKKIGNAVMRNRIRRRLRAALAEIASDHAKPDTDYVLVARPSAATVPYTSLLADLKTALGRVNAAQGKANNSIRPPKRTKDGAGVTDQPSRPRSRSATSTPNAPQGLPPHKSTSRD